MLNERKEIALLHVSSEGYYKLPGGGIEGDESMEAALEREVMEEVGAGIAILDEIGMTIEYRDSINQLQISYCYLAQVNGAVSTPAFTDYEREKGFSLIWRSLDEAMQLMRAHKPEHFIGRFIVERDLAFMEELYTRQSEAS